MRLKIPLPVRAALAVFFTAVCAAACTAQTGNRAQSGLELQTLYIHSASGQVPVETEIARTPQELAAGLMHRKTLEDGKGMLFVSETDHVQSFWMKNTLIPLSIAFILHDGTILEIKDMYPHDLSTVHSSRSARYALEVPQGWFSRAGITPGDRLNLDRL